MYFSAERLGFYLSSLKSSYEAAGTWPNDAVELTADEKEIYWQQQPPEGKKLGSDENNRPAWVDLPALSLDDLEKEKASEIDTKSQEFVDQKMESYPAFEMLTFERQEREARAFLADDTVATPTLEPITTARNLTVLEIATRVVAKADALNAVAASVAGQRQAYHDQLADAVQAQDIAAVEAITVNYVLPA